MTTTTQEQVRRSADDEPADSEPIHRAPERKGDDLDEVLDEIADVLEANAERFITSYVQKGGQ